MNTYVLGYPREDQAQGPEVMNDFKAYASRSLNDRG